MNLTGTEAAAACAAHGLLERAARDGWRGPDPYDGLAFDWPRGLVGGKRRRQGSPTHRGRHADRGRASRARRFRAAVRCPARVLECLCQLEELDVRIAEAVSRGAAAWLEQFFQPSGATTLWPRRRFPEDGHATGRALSALAALVERGHASRDQLERATTNALAAMTDRGHAVVRRHRLGTTKLRYIRWCDGHLALGLANASRVLASKEPTIESESLSALGSSPLAALPIGR